LNDERLPDPADGLVDEDIIKLQLGLDFGWCFAANPFLSLVCHTRVRVGVVLSIYDLPIDFQKLTKNITVLQ
jgi:hypothetical protein